MIFFNPLTTSERSFNKSKLNPKAKFYKMSVKILKINPDLGAGANHARASNCIAALALSCSSFVKGGTFVEKYCSS